MQKISQHKYKKIKNIWGRLCQDKIALIYRRKKQRQEKEKILGKLVDKQYIGQYYIQARCRGGPKGPKKIFAKIFDKVKSISYTYINAA